MLSVFSLGNMQTVLATETQLFPTSHNCTIRNSSFERLP